MFAKLRASLATFDLEQLAWAAEGFAADAYAQDPAALTALLDEVEEAKPADLRAALKECASKGPFECFAFAALARHAGIGEDVTHEGPMFELPTAIAGNLTVKGPLVCTNENWLLVAGNVQADVLVTGADVIIGGDAVFRDGVLGLNEWTQSMWVRGSIKAPHLVTQDYAVEMGDGPEECELSDESVDDLLAKDLAKTIRKQYSSGGSSAAVASLMKHIKGGGTVFARK